MAAIIMKMGIALILVWQGLTKGLMRGQWEGVAQWALWLGVLILVLTVVQDGAIADGPTAMPPVREAPVTPAGLDESPMDEVENCELPEQGGEARD